jgi:hypothetical protein
VHVVWEFVAVRVEEATEEAFDFESGGEDFAGWEEVLVGCVADGHLCLAVLLLCSQSLLSMISYIPSLSCGVK